MEDAAATTVETRPLLAGPLTRVFRGPLGSDGLRDLVASLDTVLRFLLDELVPLRSIEYSGAPEDVVRTANQKLRHLTKTLKHIGGVQHGASVILGETAFHIGAVSGIPRWEFLARTFQGPFDAVQARTFGDALRVIREALLEEIALENRAMAAVAPGAIRVPSFDRRAAGQLLSYLEGAGKAAEIAYHDASLDLRTFRLLEIGMEPTS